MADQILEKVRQLLEGQIDFEGQRLAELLSTTLLATVGLLAFLIGYITQNIHHTVWVGLGGTVFTFLAIIPPWPFFNKNPVGWLSPRSGLQGINIEVDGQKVG